MPELPEVETVVRGLRAPLVGHTVLDSSTDWARIIHGHSPETFGARIKGQTFTAVTRRAKYILCHLTHDYFIVHLRMTGRLYVTPDDAEHDADRWVHLRLQLDGGVQLRFSDARKFGRVYLTADLAEVLPVLGPEPLDDAFTLDVFAAQLHGRRKNIKTLLLDQSFVAGVGNIYADEALFRAGIHPLRSSETLSPEEIKLLHQSIRAALSAGVDYEGASINWYRKPDGTPGESQRHFYVYGRNAAPCRVCGTIIEKTRVTQRGTHYCPHCQPFTPNGD